jgi:hypothetical protein
MSDQQAAPPAVQNEGWKFVEHENGKRKPGWVAKDVRSVLQV